VAVFVEGRDGNLASVGPLTWTRADFTVRHNKVGAWTVTLASTPSNWDIVDTVTDLGVVIDWNGVYRFTGYVETFNPAKSVDDSGQVTETITLSGADDLGLIANREAYPAPASVWASQTVSGSDAQTGHCETVIKHFVNVNCGPGALAARQVPHLSIGTDLTRGGTVSYTARFGDGIDLAIMDIVRLLVASGGPLGVSVTQSGTSLVFDCYTPRDLSQTAWFSFGLGNLRAYSLSDSQPTCTNALVRGQSTFVETTGTGSSDGWKHVETVVDQSSSTSSTEMTQAGTAALTQGAGAAQLQVTAIDLPRLRFGADFNAGDIVTIEPRPGVTYTDTIAAVQCVADASTTTYTETVAVTVGAAANDAGDDQTLTAQLAARIRALEQQIKRLQS
jgi:hypothetical protein